VADEKSVLLPEVFKGLDDGCELSVLDLGNAEETSVDFFSQFKCKVKFLNILGSELVKEQNTLEYESLTSRLEEQIGTKPESFDLCFLWDLPNYLNDLALTALGKILEHKITSSTKIHAICGYSGRKPLPRKIYSIKDYDYISAREVNHRLIPEFVRTHSTMTKYLPFLQVAKNTLRPDGRLELLLRSRNIHLESDHRLSYLINSGT
tara:strand:+ start:56 stop:676 length:621 start_codon:yes stop_codon:yes gene_type:complete